MLSMVPQDSKNALIEFGIKNLSSGLFSNNTKLKNVYARQDQWGFVVLLIELRDERLSVED